MLVAAVLLVVLRWSSLYRFFFFANQKQREAVLVELKSCFQLRRYEVLDRGLDFKYMNLVMRLVTGFENNMDTCFVLFTVQGYLDSPRACLRCDWLKFTSVSWRGQF